MIAQTVGLAGESSGIDAVVTYSQPLFVFCLAVPFLGERIVLNRTIGTLIGFLGVVMLFWGNAKVHVAKFFSCMLWHSLCQFNPLNPSASGASSKIPNGLLPMLSRALNLISAYLLLSPSGKRILKLQHSRVNQVVGDFSFDNPSDFLSDRFSAFFFGLFRVPSDVRGYDYVIKGQ